ncbi:MAG: metalloprotease TldD [Xanthomonadales bacterium]|nr:metalloprotease TldD [Xanthomonadales bacterium]
MSGMIEIAEQQLLQPTGLRQLDLEQVLAKLMGPAIDFGDLYFQKSWSESWVLEDGIVKAASHSVDQGVGIRAISGEKTGFAYADELLPAALIQAAGTARAIARQGQNRQVQSWQRQTVPALYSAADPYAGLDARSKVELLREIDVYTRALDSRIKEVTVSISASHENILIVGSDGTYAGDIRPMIRLNVSVIVAENGRRESASAGGGGRFGHQRLLQNDAWKEQADEAVRQATVNLEAVDAPAGMMPIVLGPGWPGVMLHEAVGHGLEGDFNRKGSSAFSGRIGEQVASKLVTIVDDGTLPDRRGSLSVDDEGVASRYNTLIENGVLKGYMQDKLNGRLMGVESTGNGRRENFACLPMPRMTNTYMLAGKSEPGDIIASVEDGLYAVNFGGGQVDITSGKFVFSASEAYRIRKGKICEPVKGATLIGNGPEAMGLVSMVGNDLALDNGVGVCGKAGQSVPVGVGQPTIRIDAMTVGGTG